jgi:predicted glycoside hydrolase/deacetylase ChbG (UPF0249 family)
MALTKQLIVNADDFGQSVGINLGIIEAFERGIVTSASLMVRWAAADDAARYARSHPDLSVGLHFDLGEWAYRQGQWIPLYEVVQRDDSAAVTEEISRQLATFRTLMRREPTHIDSHQHVHRTQPVRSLLLDSANRIGIPLRFCSNIHYCGAFYGQTADGTPLWDNITAEALKGLLVDLVPGITEIGCHPAKELDFDTMYTTGRLRELEVLRDGRLREFLANNKIELTSFKVVSANT